MSTETRNARARVAEFIRQWKLHPAAAERPRVMAVHADPWKDPVELLIADLEAITKPRVVVRTVPQLQALAGGTVVMVQSGRAAQIEVFEDCDAYGELIVEKRIVYVGTDLDDHLTEPDKETLDTLRRMLPAIVIDPVE